MCLYDGYENNDLQQSDTMNIEIFEDLNIGVDCKNEKDNKTTHKTELGELYMMTNCLNFSDNLINNNINTLKK